MMIKLSCSESFDRIGAEILKGSTVVFPTDTVFGVGTIPTSQEGIMRLFEMKKRNLEKKLPILFSSIERVAKFVYMDERALHIANAFWPGQVTMILPVRTNLVPSVLVGSENTLAVRVPNHDCCLRLISACGHALIGTSANFSGSRSYTDPLQPELLGFAGQADYFVSGQCGVSSLPSTIVDLSAPTSLSILREGAIPSKAILDHLSKISKADLSLSATKS